MKKTMCILKMIVEYWLSWSSLSPYTLKVICMDFLFGLISKNDLSYLGQDLSIS
jgi:hypothetical protein